MKKRAWTGQRKADLEGEYVALVLTQPRHDAAGNKLQGYTLEEIRAMAPGERTALKAKNPWLATAEGSKEFQKLRQIFARKYQR